MKTKRISRTKKVFAATRRNLRAAISKGVSAGFEQMLILAPEDTGDLKSTLEKTDDAAGHGSLAAGGKRGKSGRMVDYEKDVEYGTTHSGESGDYHIPAQPFFRPAVDTAKQTIKRNLKVTDK